MMKVLSWAKKMRWELYRKKEFFFMSASEIVIAGISVLSFFAPWALAWKAANLNAKNRHRYFTELGKVMMLIGIAAV
jgi:hypothetical protein